MSRREIGKDCLHQGCIGLAAVGSVYCSVHRAYAEYDANAAAKRRRLDAMVTRIERGSDGLPCRLLIGRRR